ncbi:uncharacterized protein LOC125477568 [Pyrus x bretschneideri]|uniref:uncharacterized protein LOC125477568 n=1 Tax=Pyrus x bretschneideri TaxID=225117 RepID=UPI00202E2762|nr:uncharacterized protein LOC125477568 [Pyrus x bretschneideri]
MGCEDQSISGPSTVEGPHFCYICATSQMDGSQTSNHTSAVHLEVVLQDLYFHHELKNGKGLNRKATHLKNGKGLNMAQEAARDKAKSCVNCCKQIVTRGASGLVENLIENLFTK